MIQIEPTLCSRFLFGSMLVIAEGKPQLLTCRLEIPSTMTPTDVDRVFTELAERITENLITQALRIGIEGPPLLEALEDAPDPVIGQKRHT